MDGYHILIYEHSLLRKKYVKTLFMKLMYYKLNNQQFIYFFSTFQDMISSLTEFIHIIREENINFSD